MQAIGKVLLWLTVLSGVLNGFMFVATVIELLQKYVGFFAYVLWVFAAPLLSPTFLAFPWFEAWVSGAEVDDRMLGLWLFFVVCLILRGALWRWAPDRAD